jgi:hypothetical protein
MATDRIPQTEGAMQVRLEAALEHLSHVWGKLRRDGVITEKSAGWPPSPRDFNVSSIGYTLAAVTEYVWSVEQAMLRQWGTTEGQLCPYEDCAHDLAFKHSGWWTCGHCLRDMYVRPSDGDIEDYHAYLDGELDTAPAKPDMIPQARDLGPSWATPKEPGDVD